MNLNIINDYTLMKHSIIPETQNCDIVDVARKHLGLHSARIMTPYTTLCSRINQYKPQMLTSQLYEEKKLIKMRCMRTTLHMVPLEIASILHMATLDMRLADCNLFFKKYAISIEYVEGLKEILVDFVNVAKSANEIENRIIKEINFMEYDLKKECAKKILKYFWEIGVLCYVNVAENWEKEERRYAVTTNFYKCLDLKQYDIKTAQELLILEYIDKFGPATLKDLSWWSGLSIKIIRDAICKHSDSIAKLQIDDFESELYMSAIDFQKLMSYEPFNSEWVSLLAYEDPSLKGYYESRCRYVDEKYYNMLFNQIGEVRASILYNGKAIGVWEWDKKNKHINLKYFSTQNQDVKKKVVTIKEQFEYILNQNRQVTLFDSFY